jgi:hypothetical protein
VNADPNISFYLYGFTGPDLARDGAAFRPPQVLEVAGSRPGAPVLGAVGIDEQEAPFIWSYGGATAILSRVGRTVFCGATAEANLQDLAWLEPRVRRHQAVLEQVMSSAPVLPARFGTLFSSLEALARFMARHQTIIADGLARVAGQQEWALKGLLDRAQAETSLWQRAQAEDQTPPASSPGLAYLRDQRCRVKARQELGACLDRASRTLLSELAPLATDACERRLLSREATGADQEMVLNWAFLVPEHAAAALAERVRQANAHAALPGLAFALSGPWPPFSFCPALEADPA